MQIEYKNLSLDETNGLASSIGKQLMPTDVVALNGPLGAGKTSFSRSIIHTLIGPDTEVTSPTFSIVHPYENTNYIVHHFDLYRLDSLDEIYECGIEDALNDGITLIEWPQKAQTLLPPNTVYISLDFSHDAVGKTIDKKRDIKINSRIKKLHLT